MVTFGYIRKPRSNALILGEAQVAPVLYVFFLNRNKFYYENSLTFPLINLNEANEIINTTTNNKI